MADKSVNLDLGQFYSAEGHEVLMERYDRNASVYDQAMEEYQWKGPSMMLPVVERYVRRDGCILDGGAGTGLMGETLTRAGFTHLEAMDPSPGLLAEAAKKNIYRETRLMTMGEPLDYPDDRFDAVVVIGVFTPGHAPAHSFDELVRITRGGGHIIYTLRSDVTPPGFIERMQALVEKGAWTLAEQGEPFQSLPDGEPEVHHRVWAYRVV